MRLSCSQILTQRGEGRLGRGWRWGALNSSSLSVSHLSDVGSSCSGGLAPLAQCAGGLVREAGLAPSGGRCSLSRPLPGLPAAAASRGEALGGVGAWRVHGVPTGGGPEGQAPRVQMPC